RGVPERLRRAGGAERSADSRDLRAIDRARSQAALSRVHAAHVASPRAQPGAAGHGGAEGVVHDLRAGGGARGSERPKTAMVLAAGLGTRMRPLTNDRPKALVDVGGKPLIDHTLERLADAGVETAVVNVHWFADRLESHLAERARPQIVISDERSELLETG